jgi:DNA-directed RNA polymerase specialized sigma24 family protein
MSDVTRLLDAAAAGDRRATADLLPLVYDELRKLAAARRAAEATLDATALVHEAYLRLVGDQHPRRGGAGQTPGSGTEGLRPVVG